ncbi:MAG: hypothetical protein JO199_07760 [Candidatus Eremiobacteraeota bacterium]|nr:hypothetical protein [Candidatus Eremiobacteraeota bacterium]
MIALAAFLLVASASATPAPVQAPADQYFGKLKVSALRIRYEAMQVKAHYESHRLLPEEAEHLAELNQDAFDDWARKFPRDPWLPSTAHLQIQLYEELPGPQARDRAETLLQFIVKEFPHSEYAGDSRATLRRGLPERPDPAWAATMRASKAAGTPAATTVPSPAPSGGVATPGASAAPSAGASPPPE